MFSEDVSSPVTAGAEKQSVAQLLTRTLTPASPCRSLFPQMVKSGEALLLSWLQHGPALPRPRSLGRAGSSDPTGANSETPRSHRLGQDHDQTANRSK